MAKRKPPAKPRAARKPRQQATQCEQYPEWTEAKFWGFIRSALRSGANKWPPKWKVLSKSKRAIQSTRPTKAKWEYLCNDCGNWFRGTEVSVDHIVPAGSLKSYDDLVEFTRRLFVGEEGLQCLCRDCHKRKTATERSASGSGRSEVDSELKEDND